MSATQKTKNRSAPLRIQNRRAHFDYAFLETFTAGIVLRGTEIKSIRMGKASLQDAYAYFKGNTLWVKGMHIGLYAYGTIYNHEEKRERQLLIRKAEQRKLLKGQGKGLTLVPTQLFINDRGLAKLEIALARGKKAYDKRQTIKERDQERAIRNAAA